MRIFSLFFFIIFTFPLIAQLEQGSNLPIIVIDAFGETIFDEPKIEADLYIYYDSTASVNFIEDEFLHYSGNSGVEKRGQSSLQLFPKNGYAIETRKDDGSNNNVPLFGWPKENDWVLHGPYSDKTLIRNALAYKLGSQVMPYAPRTKICELIVNGSYEGVYIFTEKIKRDKGRVDISKLKPEDNEGDQLTGGYMLKFDKGDPEDLGWESDFDPIAGQFQRTSFFLVEPDRSELSEQQFNYIKTYFDEFESRLMDSDYKDSINGYRAFIDVENFINFMLHQELTGNVDSYRLSTYMYKDRDSVDSKFKMGPVWDYNLAFGNVNYCNGNWTNGWRWDFNEHCPEDFWLNHVWWNRLLSDPFFTDALKDQWANLRQTKWSDEQVIACIDSMVNIVEPSVSRNFDRWPVLGLWIWPNNIVANSHVEEVDYLKGWILDRMAWIDTNINTFVTADEQQIPDPGVTLDPNPNSGSFELKWNRQVIRPGAIMIFNSNGKLLLRTEDVNAQVFSKSFELDLLPGIYYYVLENSEEVLNGRFVVSR